MYRGCDDRTVDPLGGRLFSLWNRLTAFGHMAFVRGLAIRPPDGRRPVWTILPLAAVETLLTKAAFRPSPTIRAVVAIGAFRPRLGFRSLFRARFKRSILAAAIAEAITPLETIALVALASITLSPVACIPVALGTIVAVETVAAELAIVALLSIEIAVAIVAILLTITVEAVERTLAAIASVVERTIRAIPAVEAVLAIGTRIGLSFTRRLVGDIGLRSVAVVAGRRIGLTVVDVVTWIVWIKTGLAEALRLLGRPARLLLLTIRHDDAIIMFGVLQIVFSQHGVACRCRVSGERHVFFRYMHRRAPYFHVGTVGFVTPRQRVLPFALPTIIVAASTAAAAILMATTIVATIVLLTWPHG